MDGYAFEARFTSVRPLGITPVGLRIDVEFAGLVTDGPLAGKGLAGIDYLLIRADGIGQIDAREVISDGGTVLACPRVLGYIVPPLTLPPLEVVADPGFDWPDVDLPIHGAAYIETAVDDLAAARSTVYAWNGTVNVATATIRVSAMAIPQLLPTAAALMSP
jgi:hypothetical protein